MNLTPREVREQGLKENPRDALLKKIGTHKSSACDGIHQFRKAYAEGVAAHVAGKPVTDNPYPDLNKGTKPGSNIVSDPPHGGWNSGWVERDIVVNG